MTTLVRTEQQRTLNLLNRAGRLVQAAAVFVALLGFVAAIVLLLYTRTDESFAGDASKERPYVGLGLGLLFGSLVQGLLLWTVGLGARAWAVVNYPWDSEDD